MHHNIGRGAGASVYLPDREMPKGAAMKCVSYLEARERWRERRQQCALITATWLTALFTLIIAVASVAGLFR